jgi:hypothetical protein
MAYTDLAPQSFFQNVTQGTAQKYSVLMFDSTGAAVNTAAWNAFRLKVFPAGGLGTATPPLDITTGVTGGATAITVALTAAQTTALFPGNLDLIVEGQPVVADDYQVMCQGTLSVQPSIA